MHPIDSIEINFEQDQLFLLNICLAVIMFGIALDLTMEDFKRLLREPRSALIGLSSQLILLPILTFVLVMTWDMSPSVALGLIMVASCPGGNISNYAVYLGRGNAALSISMTSMVTLLAAVLTPITFSLWSSFVPGAEPLLRGVEVDFLAMVLIIGQLIVLPLLIGMSIRHYRPKWAAVMRKPINILSLAIFTAIIVVALYENAQQMKDYLHLVFWLVLVHNGLALLMGYSWATAWRLPTGDRKAISMETGIQNSGLGLILIFNFFDGLGGMMLVAAWWGVWDMISGLTLALIWRWRGQS